MGGSTVRLGVSDAMQEVGQDIALAAQCGARVLITGEHGAGKATVARLIHEFSPRAAGRFVPVPCEGTSDWSLGAGLFGQMSRELPAGRRPGAFELAHQGTLFLDEIGDVSSGVQARLVRYIDTAEIQPIAADSSLPPLDVRLVTASSRPLTELVDAGKFREDLFYRLNMIHITVPPLRHRREDVIPLLTDRLAGKAAEAGVQPPELTPAMAERLTRYDWPGNVRQLHGLADALVKGCAGRPVEPGDLPEEFARPRSASRRAADRFVSTRRFVHQARGFTRGALGPLVMQRVRAH